MVEHETVCAMCQDLLARRFPLPHALALWWLRPTPDEDDIRAKAHVASCGICRSWLDAHVPVDIMQRQKMALRYCCVSMFAAVEEADPDEDVVVSFMVIRGEACWSMDGKQTFFAYCPWCGSALPDHPFIERAR